MTNLNRFGISVIEVLTAMVVAMIGVFGVMILIPFAVQQAQIGLDNDDAATMGRNAVEMLEIEGYTNGNSLASRWNIAYNPDAMPPDPVITLANIGVPAGPYWIDPLMIANNYKDPTPVMGTYGVFPTNSQQSATTATEPFNWSGSGLEFQICSILDQVTGLPMSPALARRSFRGNDDLNFGGAVPDYQTVPGLPGPPQQLFDVFADVNVRRQRRGRFSWSMLAVPVKRDYSAQPTGGTRAWNMQMHVLVHKDRSLNNAYYRVAEVDTGRAPPTLINGGTVFLETDEITDIRRDDWVMLVSRRTIGQSTSDDGFSWQVAFYRVIGADQGDLSAATPRQGSVTLDGPDFAVDTTQTTLMVHLVQRETELIPATGPDRRTSGRVVNVFERSLNWERESSWTSN